MSSSPNSQRRFATTSWTIVRDASCATDSKSQIALESLCRTYWYPIYAYLRRRGIQAEDAQDITQSFIASLLAKNSFTRADPELGRFRSFLLGSLKKFVIDWQRKRQAQKRGGASVVFSIDSQAAESRYGIEPADTLTPERIFDRNWAMTVLNETMSRLEEIYAGKGQSQLFALLRPHLGGDAQTTGYSQIAAELETTEGAIKAAAHRLKKRYRKQLQDLISETVTGPDELRQELNDLFASLS